MNYREVGRFWDANAQAWTDLARKGYDVYRDYLNTPAFFQMLPDVGGSSCLDIGCGEGHNTRLLAQRGARVVALDISQTFTRNAHQLETQQSFGIAYLVASAVELPFASDHFDCATAFMSLMDIPETERTLAETHRVLKPGGFFQFSITHPCFDTPHRVNLRNEDGITYAIEVGDYFRCLQGDTTEWIFSSTPPEIRTAYPYFKVPRFTRPLSYWLNTMVDVGFQIEHINEPHPSDETVRQCPTIQDAQIVAYFLHVRLRKPS